MAWKNFCLEGISYFLVQLAAGVGWEKGIKVYLEGCENFSWYGCLGFLHKPIVQAL